MSLFLLLLSISCVFAEDFKLAGLFFGCERDLTLEYHKALQDFSTRLFKEVALQNNDHFALSQYSIWLALSAIAESAVGDTQTTIFKALNLPQDNCYREKYYEIATSIETSAEDVTLCRKRLLAVNRDINLNTTWKNAVRASGLIDTHVFTNESQVLDMIDAKTKLDIAGNSIILDSLDYEGLWTSAFQKTESADFFNDKGEKIGKVNLMRVKKRVKIAHILFLNAKLMEIPVGNNGRYRMLFIMNLGRQSIRRTIEHFPSSFIIDIMPLLIESVVPLEVAIPKFKMTSEIDLKDALEKIGLDVIWKDSNATRYISTPSSSPSTLLQRVTIATKQDGVTPSPSIPLPSLSNIATGIAGVVGRGFVANRPFVYGLVDAQTRTWLFSGAFSKPDE